jgi:hypothetical protein
MRPKKAMSNRWLRTPLPAALRETFLPLGPWIEGSAPDEASTCLRTLVRSPSKPGDREQTVCEDSSSKIWGRRYSCRRATSIPDKGK